MESQFILNSSSWEIDHQLLDEFRNYSVANIGDCLNRNMCIGRSRLQIANQKKLVGFAYTVKVPAGDNLALYYAIDKASPGDVIIVDGEGFLDRALCGEIMLSYAQARGINGVIVNGAIRDLNEVENLDMPVFYAGVNPNGPYKNGPGKINVPISIHNQVVQPGDLVVGDQDGLVFLNKEQVGIVQSGIGKVIEKERKLLDSIEKSGKLDLFWVYEKLQGGEVK